jgi:hypothetical protein
MKGLGKWASAVDTARSARLKAQKKKISQGKSLLSEREPTSGSGESAAVHFAQTSHLSFGDKSRMSDNDPAVVKLWKRSLSLEVMHQHSNRRRKPGLQEGSHPDER